MLRREFSSHFSIIFKTVNKSFYNNLVFVNFFPSPPYLRVAVCRFIIDRYSSRDSVFSISLSKY